MATHSNPEKPYIQIAALGHPFKLGMLYDCCKEVLIEKSSLWDREVLKGCQYQVLNHSKVPGVIREDTIESKAKVLNLSAHLRLSFLSDLIEPLGASMYLDDKISSPQQERITVFVKQSTVFCGLKMKQLQVKDIYLPKFNSDSGATHVVTGIMYGGLALFVFDQHHTKFHQQGESLEVLIKRFLESETSGRVNLTEEQKKQAESLEVRFYSDFVKYHQRTNYTEAVEIYKSLPEYFGRNGENAVPTLVWLYPLSNIDSWAPKLVTEISTNLVLAVEHIFEFIHHVDITCIAFMKNEACQNFSGLYAEMKFLKQMLRDFKVQFQAQLFRAVPNIRAGKLAANELSLMLQKIEQSPFNEKTINEWLRQKEQNIQSEPHLYQSGNDPFLQNLETYLFEITGKSQERSGVNEAYFFQNLQPGVGQYRDFSANINEDMQQEHALHMDENEGTIYQNIFFRRNLENKPARPFPTNVLSEKSEWHRQVLPERPPKRPPKQSFFARKSQEPLRQGAEASKYNLTADRNTKGSEFQSQAYGNSASNIPYGTQVNTKTSHLLPDERQHYPNNAFFQGNTNSFHAMMMPGENLSQFVHAVPDNPPPYQNVKVEAEQIHHQEVHPHMPQRTGYQPQFSQSSPCGNISQEQSAESHTGRTFAFQPCVEITSDQHTGLTSQHDDGYEVPICTRHAPPCLDHIYETPEQNRYIFRGDQPQRHGQYLRQGMPASYHQNPMAQAPFPRQNICTVHPYQKDVIIKETPFCTCSRCEAQRYHSQKQFCTCEIHRNLCQHTNVSAEEKTMPPNTKDDEVQLKEKDKEVEKMTPSKPNPPNISKKTHESITLSWEKPVSKTEIISYDLSWKDVEGADQTTLNIKSSKRSYAISNLQPGRKYEFKIKAYSEEGPSEYSESTEPVRTLPTSPPGKPTVKKMASKTRLEWSAPLSIGKKIRIKAYIILYSTEDNSADSEDDEEQWLEFTTVPGNKSSTDIKVPANVPHKFKIRANCSSYGESEPSPESDVFYNKVSGPELLKSKVRAEVQMLKRGAPSIYKLSVSNTLTNAKENIRKCELGPPPINSVTDKVIMIVGATGSGKSTLLNGLINYILGVEWMDDFRVKLIVESTEENQAKSQTSWITSYTIHHQSSYSVPFTLTVIDTPGFGDTAGITRDKKITEQITKFFTTHGQGGIDHLDAVGFVAQASLPRLTPTQRYIFDSILALFGKDITGNIFVLVTFADGQEPPVLHGLHEARLPYEKYFKFNNSALFATNEEENDEKDEGNFGASFWNMGKKSFQLFLEALGKVETKTLLLTKDVLNERSHLEAYIQGIQIDIQLGLNKLEQLEKEKQILKTHQADIDINKDFEYVVEEETVELVPIEKDTYTTNCLICKRTCHHPCIYAGNEDKVNCASMKDGKCTVCPGKCDWNIHKNLPHIYEIKRVSQKKTAADLKQRYEEATGKKLSAEQLVQEVQNDFDQIQMKVIQQTENARKTLKRLSEIALKPNPLSTTEYIDLLIDSEKAEAKPGWKQRVDQLTKVRQEAEWMKQLADKGFDPFKEYKQRKQKTSGDVSGFDNLSIGDDQLSTDTGKKKNPIKQKFKNLLKI